IVNDAMHHGSVINTLCHLHGLTPLSQRDESANSLFTAVNLDVPRQPALWPDAYPPFLPLNPESNTKAPHEQHANRPLTPPAEGLLGILLAKYAPNEKVPSNYAEAYEALKKHGSGLFGVNDVEPDNPRPDKTATLIK
ncbi:MAG: hypothetical protein JWO10_681, partial [Microbacteriaceae bacterium]|nr:hypothetical protein [Microbacteriaceae bacterium]